jgi:hypothetical protein
MSALQPDPVRQLMTHPSQELPEVAASGMTAFRMKSLRADLRSAAELMSAFDPLRTLTGRISRWDEKGLLRRG